MRVVSSWSCVDPYATACLTTLPIRSGPISIFLFAVLSSPPPIFTTTSVGLAKPAPLVPTSLRHRSVQIYARQNHVRHLGYLLPPVPHQACQNHVRSRTRPGRLLSRQIRQRPWKGIPCRPAGIVLILIPSHGAGRTARLGPPS